MGQQIREALQQVAVRLLARARLYPSASTDPAQLRSLLQALSPVRPEKELIRLGPRGDGGYLLPDDLAGIAACFSPGVSSVSGFELDCANRGMQVFLADRTVDGPAGAHPLFHFMKKHVGATTNDGTMPMDAWVSSSLPDNNSELLLQMDVEGAEYETLLATSDALLRRFRIILIELHLLDHLWGKPFFRIASAALEKLLQTHVCVHIHPNNCCGSLRRDGLEIPRVAEFTFVRRDRMSHSEPAVHLPHPLDADNDPRRGPLHLPALWSGGE